MSPRATRYLPHALLATLAVALLPIAVAWSARAGRVISSPWLCACVTVSLSLIASAAGSWYWKRRPGSGDVLFSDLLLWGWLRRLRVEHQLDDATRALGLAAPPASPCSDADLSGGAVANTDRQLELLTRLADALEAHDPYVDGHSRRVARHASVIARKLGLPAEEVAKVARAAAVHDVGKLRLPREILMKPDALTAAEFEVIKSHSTEGAEMVACLGDPELTAIVRHHHERLDGSGYPAGLRGAEIPLGARIIAVADTFDAITSARPYRPPARHKQAIDTLVHESGVQLDAEAVRAFVSYYSGSRVLVAWAILAAIPQRAVAWARQTALPTHSLSAMPAATSAAATLVIGAVAVIPPIGLWHSQGQSGGHHQVARPQLAAAAFPATTPISLVGSSQSRAHGARGAATRRVHLRRPARGVRVTNNLRRIPSTAAASHVSGRSVGTQSRGKRSVAITKGSPGNPSRRAPGGSPAGSGSGTGGRPSGGSGGGSNTTAGSTSASATSSTPPSSSAGVTTGGPVISTAATSGGSATPAPSSGTTGVTSTGGTSGGTTGGTVGGTTTGGTTGGTPPPGQPTTKAQCMDGGYAAYGFKNQGQCIDFVVHQAPQP